MACGLLAGVGLAVAPALPVVRSSVGTDAKSLGWAALVAGLAALLVPAVAALVAATRRFALAGGILVGGGVVSAPMLMLDVAMLRAPIDANRFELFRPLTASPLSPAVGAYLVLGAHLLAVVAAILGAMVIARAALGDGYGHSVRQDLAGRATIGRAGPAVTGLALLFATVWGVCLFFPAWTSSDSIIVVAPLVTAGILIFAATVALAVSACAVVAGALAATSPEVTAGAIGGAGVTALGISGSRLAAGVCDDGLRVGPATVIATVAAALLVVTAVALLRIVAAREASDAAPSMQASGDRGSPLVGADVARWHRAAGIAGVITALLVGVGALLPVLTAPEGHELPQIYATRLAIVGAAMLLVPSIFLFLSEFAATVRPAMGPILLAIVLVAAGVAQAAVSGTRIPGVGFGLGTVVTVLGVLAAVATGLVVWCAGSAERDDVDRSAEPTVQRTASILGVAAAVAAALALALPLYVGPEFDATSFALPWGFDTWAQALLAAGIVVVATVAPRSRPTRGAAMLIGAAAASAVYLLGWPLTIDRIADGAQIGPAVPSALVAIGLLVAEAVVVVRSGKSA